MVEVTLDMIAAGEAEFTRRFAEQCRGARPAKATREAAAIAIYAAMVKASTRTPAQVEMLVEAQWKPIETAPKDGTRILVWDGRYGAGRAVASWSWADNPARGKWLIVNDCECENPTHWMPLPEPPALAQFRASELGEK